MVAGCSVFMLCGTNARAGKIEWLRNYHIITAGHGCHLLIGQAVLLVKIIEKCGFNHASKTRDIALDLRVKIKKPAVMHAADMGGVTILFPGPVLTGQLTVGRIPL